MVDRLGASSVTTGCVLGFYSDVKSCPTKSNSSCRYLPTARNKRVAHLRHKVHEMLESIIQARREAGAKAVKRSDGAPAFGDDLLGRLLSATDEEGASLFHGFEV
jgi:cytochrome P450